MIDNYSKITRKPFHLAWIDIPSFFDRDTRTTRDSFENKIPSFCIIVSNTTQFSNFQIMIAIWFAINHRMKRKMVAHASRLIFHYKRCQAFLFLSNDRMIEIKILKEKKGAMKSKCIEFIPFPYFNHNLFREYNFNIR